MQTELPGVTRAAARRITATLFALAIGLCWHPMLRAGAKEGLAALELSDYRTALRELTPAAEQGDTAAQAALGKIHLHGWGVAQDPVAAARWFRRAAEAGDTLSQRMLVFLYETGTGVPKDIAEAKRWQAASEAGASLRYAPRTSVR